jgi:glycosyltransferase involved in cell wall biosynthesis
MPTTTEARYETAPAAQRGVRVVVDLRPLQQADRGPITAAYLRNLLGAFAAAPLEGEEFVALLQAGLPDPTESLTGLPIVGRRWIPPTRSLRASSLTVDPFVLRGALMGAGHGAHGAVYHVAGAGLPLGLRLPVVATLMDLAPWELPHAYQGSPAARFGERLRARMLQDARVIVGGKAVARSAIRLLHLHPGGVSIVPFAANPMAAAITNHAGALATLIKEERQLLGLPERYLIFVGRYDARTDLPTLLDALALLDDKARPESLGKGVPWPPALLLAGASDEDNAALERAAKRRGLGERLFYTSHLSEGRLATLTAGARAAIRPSISDAVGAPALDAIACGTPVVASAVGALPEVVGGAGVIVEPRDPARMARAIEALWCDDSLHAQLRDAAVASAKAGSTWADVARLTRAVYAKAAFGE